MSENHGKVYWNELNTRDVEGAKAYYGKICGWTFDAMPMAQGGEYVIAKLGDDMVGGMFDITGMPGLDHVPAHWLTYFGVDDVDASVAASTEAGGKVIREPFDIPNVGRISIVEDATGAVIGLMTGADG